MKALGYLRVSTGRQAESGAGIEAQRRSILAEAERRGWAEADVQWVEETASGSTARRPGLEQALAALKAGEADVLIVAKVDRLARSLLDFVKIMKAAQNQGWVLVALDTPVDMNSAVGEAVASVLAVFAQLEKRLIGQRTKDALAEKRASGVKLGRPRALPDPVRHRIHAERREGKTLKQIAEALNRDQVATAHRGKQWYPSTVRVALK